MTTKGDGPWLLLIHQLPAKPAYARVKIWRRLQGLGAVTVKNGVYALPANSETREDFAWLAKEIVEAGGESLVCEANLIEGLTDRELRALFDAARDEDYGRLAGEARELAARLGEEAADVTLAEIAGQTARLRKQFDQVVAIDFFGAEGRAGAQGLLAGLEGSLQGKGETVSDSSNAPAAPGELKQRTWVTRTGVQIDRIASAWLIRRFIDPEARFKFVAPRGYTPEAGELRFDMFEGEYTHEGDRCTFEVLLLRAGIDDTALRAIAEIIHDIDLKDDKYGREETAGIRNLIAGIAATQREDVQRIARGSAVLDDLYEFLRSSK
jgi:hypothetical protein